jgi:N-acetylglucosaminyl-diphospho-decaprenol L-rhamnosyltransferase
MRHLDLAIVIVSWNVRELLRRCLRSIDASLRGTQISYRIVVVDNASTDGSASMVRDKFSHVLLIENTTNRGFAGGNNDGLRALGLFQPTDEHLRWPRYVMLLNPDTEIVGDALSRLVSYLDEHPGTIAVGPQLRYGDGSLQSSRRRFPSIPMLFMESTILEQWWPANPWARRYRMEDRPPLGDQPVNWLVGAALMVRAEAIEAAGPLDEGFFMYSEELEWQYRLAHLRRSGRSPIVYLAGAVIIHHEGRSSEQNILRRHVDFQRSKLRYARMRFGPLVAVLLRLFLLATYTLQAVIEGLKWLLGHKRRLRAARVGQYLRIIASGL